MFYNLKGDCFPLGAQFYVLATDVYSRRKEGKWTLRVKLRQKTLQSWSLKMLYCFIEASFPTLKQCNPPRLDFMTQKLVLWIFPEHLCSWLNGRRWSETSQNAVLWSFYALTFYRDVLQRWNMLGLQASRESSPMERCRANRAALTLHYHRAFSVCVSTEQDWVLSTTNFLYPLCAQSKGNIKGKQQGSFCLALDGKALFWGFIYSNIAYQMKSTLSG